MQWSIIPGYDFRQELGELFAAYGQMLVAGDAAMAAYLNQQGYAEELDHLQEKYGGADGRLYIAVTERGVSGCVALRRLNGECCEMKRLYVDPACRGCGIGRALVRRVKADARDMGYAAMLLDTLPFLTDAVALYEQEGFYRIPRYNDSPLEQTYFYRLDL